MGARASASKPRVHLRIVEDEPIDVSTVAGAERVAGVLGEPSKMPGYAYGLSAKLCNVGSKLREIPGSVCSKCFAMTGWYRSWRPLLKGHDRREQGIRHPQWVDAMVTMIGRYCVGEHAFFRWHDSGDLRGVWHLQNIVTVCNSTPTVRHWLPTREYEVVAKFLDDGGVIPPNLTVRLSAHMIDCEPVFPPELEATLAALPVSTVSSVPLVRSDVKIIDGKGSVECRAIEVRDNKCGDCRACWDKRVKSVNYPEH
jgi:hypothetical protein